MSKGRNGGDTEKTEHHLRREDLSWVRHLRHPLHVDGPTKKVSRGRETFAYLVGLSRVGLVIPQRFR